MIEISEGEFQHLVEAAVAQLPDEFRLRLENLQIVIEDEPTEDDYAENEVPDDEDLFGLFEGVPLTEASGDLPAPLPSRIRIFRLPHEAVCDTLEELREEVRRTVHHEIAHHFGIDDDRLEEIGAY